MALVCASPPSRAGATQAAGAALFADGRAALSVGVPGGKGGSVGNPVGSLVGALLTTTGGGLRGAGLWGGGILGCCGVRLRAGGGFRFWFLGMWIGL